jgi:hypothetical protein
MPPSGMLSRMAVVRTNVSEEHIASIIRATRIGELETTLAAPSYRNTLRRNVICVFLCSSETSIPTGHTRRNITEDDIVTAVKTSNLS